QLELEALGLQAPKAMHDPVVLFDQHGIEPPLIRDDCEQLIEVPPIMQKISHPTTLSGASAWTNCQNDQRHVATGLARTKAACCAPGATPHRDPLPTHPSCSAGPRRETRASASWGSVASPENRTAGC